MNGIVFVVVVVKKKKFNRVRRVLKVTRHIRTAATCIGVRAGGAGGGCSPPSRGNNVIFRAKRS